MLVPAIIYKNEITTEMSKRMYDESFFLYTGYIGSNPDIVCDNFNGSTYQFAIVDKQKLIGYFEYCWNVYCKSVNQFGLISFDSGNKRIGVDVLHEIKKPLHERSVHRIEWRMVGGNPVERHYDNFCRRHGGKKHVLKDALRDKHGNFRDDIIYEIIKNEEDCYGDTL